MTRDSSVYSQWSRPDVFMPSNTFLIIRQLWIISASLFHHKTHKRREHNLHNTRGLYCTWFHKRNPSGVEWSCFYPQTPCEFSIWDSLTADYNTIICQSDIKWVISLKWNSNLTQEFVDSFNEDSVSWSDRHASWLQTLSTAELHLPHIILISITGAEVLFAYLFKTQSVAPKIHKIINRLTV